jgi:hypothetical protein
VFWRRQQIRRDTRRFDVIIRSFADKYAGQAASAGQLTDSFPGSFTEKCLAAFLAAFLVAEATLQSAEPDTQPRLAGELEVAMHVGNRHAAFAYGCRHALD